MNQSVLLILSIPLWPWGYVCKLNYNLFINLQPHEQYLCIFRSSFYGIHIFLHSFISVTFH